MQIKMKWIQIYFVRILLKGIMSSKMIKSNGSKCLPGSSECVDNIMKMCDINGKWVFVDCPNGTKCGIESGRISCMLENNNVVPKKALENKEKERKIVEDKNGDDKNGDDKNNDDDKIEDKIDNNDNNNDRNNDKSVDNTIDHSVDDKIDNITEENKPNEKKLNDNKKFKNNPPRTITVIKTKKRINEPVRTVTIYKSINDKNEDFEKDIKNDKNNKKDNDNKNIDNGIKNNDNGIKNNDNGIKNNDNGIKNTIDHGNNNFNNHSKEFEVAFNKKGEEFLKSIADIMKNQFLNKTTTVTVTQQTAPKEIRLEYTTPDKVDPVVSKFNKGGVNGKEVEYGNKNMNVKGMNSNGKSANKKSGLVSSEGGAASSPTSGDSSGLGSEPSVGGTSTPSGSVSENAGSTPTTGSSSLSAPPAAQPSTSPAAQPSTPPAAQPATEGNATSAPASSGSSTEQTPSTGTKPAEQGGSTGTDSTSASSGSGSSGDSNQKDDKKEDSNKGSGGQMITEEALTKVMKSQGFAPKPEYIKAAVKQTNSEIKDKSMAAQLLAQLGHESGGFQYIEEIACAGNKCAGQYGSDKGAPGKQYYGRGFIQLSWPENYSGASQDLFKNKSLFEDPDKVAKDPDIGMKVSIWFWNKNVMGKPGVGPDHFGYTTKAINGALECTGQNVDKSKKRYEIYKAIAKEMKLEKVADEKGCYS